jgi:hypothetical protein
VDGDAVVGDDVVGDDVVGDDVVVGDAVVVGEAVVVDDDVVSKLESLIPSSVFLQKKEIIMKPKKMNKVQRTIISTFTGNFIYIL